MPISGYCEPPANKWVQAWPDALAFGVGLGLAWWLKWETRDLVWSLWLSSLVIGYAMIVWSIFGPGVYVLSRAAQDRAMLAGGNTGPATLGGALMLTGGLFLLAFFTVHFGMFHFVHSVFLNAFFPVDPTLGKAMPGPALYWEVWQRYWWFLPATALAERAAFRWGPGETKPADTAVTSQAIAARKARQAQGGGMMAPYRNVMRMHFLIFFFAGVSILKIESFAIYAVVYAVYFFPWRLLRKA